MRELGADVTAKFTFAKFCAPILIFLSAEVTSQRHSTMGHNNWDAALVIRANELLSEVRRYHADAEATRLQLASAAASMTRKVAELPTTVRQVVEESLHQDPLTAERPIIVKRLDLSTQMLNDLSVQLHGSGILFLRHIRRIVTCVLLVCFAISMCSTWWSVTKAAEAMRLSSEIAVMRKTIFELRQVDDHSVIKPCIDAFSRSRLCVRIDESAGKFKNSYYFVDQRD